MDIEQVIKQSIEDLPKWCRLEYGTHEWINAYGKPDCDYLVPRVDYGDHLLTYEKCKFCYKRRDCQD